MPCFYYSPNANASTKPENVLFTEAELGANVLRIGPLPWQDQYNLNEKGMTPLDMHLLLTSLEAIERVCTHEKGKQEEKAEKASFNGKKEEKGQVLILRPAFPRKSVFSKNCDLCKKHGGAHTTHSTGECRKYEKDGTKKSSFRAAKKGGKRSYTSNQTSCS